MKISTRVIWFTIIVAIAVGGVTWWKLLPTHKQEFFKNFARQIKYLPARYVA
jgi:hypothetical protein